MSHNGSLFNRMTTEKSRLPDQLTINSIAFKALEFENSKVEVWVLSSIPDRYNFVKNK